MLQMFKWFWFFVFPQWLWRHSSQGPCYCLSLELFHLTFNLIHFSEAKDWVFFSQIKFNLLSNTLSFFIFTRPFPALESRAFYFSCKYQQDTLSLYLTDWWEYSEIFATFFTSSPAGESVPQIQLHQEGNLASSKTKERIRVKQLFTLFELRSLTQGSRCDSSFSFHSVLATKSQMNNAVISFHLLLLLLLLLVVSLPYFPSVVFHRPVCCRASLPLRWCQIIHPLTLKSQAAVNRRWHTNYIMFFTPFLMNQQRCSSLFNCAAAGQSDKHSCVCRNTGWGRGRTGEEQEHRANLS